MRHIHGALRLFARLGPISCPLDRTSTPTAALRISSRCMFTSQPWLDVCTPMLTSIIGSCKRVVVIVAGKTAGPSPRTDSTAAGFQGTLTLKCENDVPGVNLRCVACAGGSRVWGGEADGSISVRDLATAEKVPTHTRRSISCSACQHAMIRGSALQPYVFFRCLTLSRSRTVTATSSPPPCCASTRLCGSGAHSSTAVFWACVSV